MHSDSSAPHQAEFFKAQIISPYLQGRTKKLFEDSLAFDPSLLDYPQSQLCAQPLLTHLVISSTEAAFPYAYFGKEFLYQMESLIKSSEKGDVRLFVSMNPTQNCIVLYKDYLWNGMKLVALEKKEYSSANIKRPILFGLSILAFLTVRDKNSSVIWVKTVEQMIHRIPVRRAHNMCGKLVKAGTIEDVLVQRHYLLKQLDYLQCPQKHNVQISIVNQNEYVCQVLIQSSKKPVIQNESEAVLAFMKALQYFHRALNLSVGQIQLCLQSPYFIYGFFIQEGCLQLFANDICLLVSRIMQKYIHSGEIYLRLNRILMTGDDQAVIYEFQQLIKHLSTSSQTQKP